MMLLAIILYIVHRWATGRPAVTLAVVLSGIFAVLVIEAFDHGKAEPVAKGFAFLFLLVAAYNAIPAFTGALQSAQATKAGLNGPGPAAQAM